MAFSIKECDMTKLLFETRISLTQAAQQLGVNTSTCWRWAQKGVRNIRLETLSIGAKRYTTEEALERFVEETTRAASGESPQRCPRTSRSQQHDMSDAERFLDSENC